MTDQERIEKALDRLEVAVTTGERGIRGALASAFMMGMNTMMLEEAAKENDARAHIIRRLDAWLERVTPKPDVHAEFKVRLVPNGEQWDEDGTLFYEFRVTEWAESEVEGFVPGVPKKENP